MKHPFSALWVVVLGELLVAKANELPVY